MKVSFSIVGALLVLVAGIAMIALHGTMSAASIVLVVGLVFLVPSVINVLIYMYQHHESDKEVVKRYKGEDVPQKKSTISTFTLMTSIGAIILGLILIIFSSDFVGLLAFIFGITLALFGLFHFIIMFINYRKIHFSPLLYLLPVALIGLAISCFLLTPGMDHSLLILLAGIGLVVFAVTIFVEKGYKAAHNRQLKRQVMDLDTAGNTTERVGEDRRNRRVSDDEAADDAIPVVQPTAENSGASDSGDADGDGGL